MELDFNTIEEQARQLWKEQDVYRVVEDTNKPKYYVLDMFPYPSGAGLHVGHPLGYIASDIVARYKRLKGFNVLHPMGFDAFGLPAEQYAIQTGQHPAITTEKNIETYRKQLDKIGFSFDWSREVRTNDPKFYKWTQWIFLQLFKSWYNKTTDRAEPLEALIKEFETAGNTNVSAACSEVKPFSSTEWKNFSEKEQQEILMDYRVAFLAEAYVNWCPALGTVLANDEVKDGVSERGGYPVERKLMKQWMLRITAYSERLLTGLDTLDWSESMKEAQRNWIGKSEGCSIRFKAKSQKSKVDDDLSIEVFSTRPDTIFGATFIALAPEHELIEKITPPDYKTKVADYVHYAKNRSERERQTEVKKITGQFTGAYVIHPFTQQPIPVWVGEYVLAGYGTGAVMGVPGHDQRDWDFANYFKLPIISILQGVNVSEQPYEDKNGILANSDFLNGLTVSDAIKKTIDDIEKRGIGKRKVNYKQRDAVFGRQRYWGEPIPIYYKDGIPYAVDERDLPIVLPEVDKFLPTETGEPPLARAKDWKYSPPAPPQPSPKGRELSSSLDEAKGEAQPKVSPLGGDLEGAGGDIPEYQTSNNKNWKYLKDFAKEHRQNPTPAEEVIWEKVRDHKLGEHIRRQHAIGNYIVDFVCLSKRLVIEIDGDIHDYKKEDDVARENYLKEVGYTVIRFKNEDVLKNTGNVIIKIKEALSAPPQPSPKGSPAPSQPSPKGKEFGQYINDYNQSAQPKISPFGGDLEGAGAGTAYPLETTTMPGWAGSSWYFLRYMDPRDDKAFASKQAMDYWKQIDLYIGGNEHATGHLLYFRFWTKFLKDRGLISIDEPAKKLVNQGMIQGVSKKIYRINGVDRSGNKIRSVNKNINDKILNYYLSKNKKDYSINIDSDFIEIYISNELIELLNSKEDLSLVYCNASDVEGNTLNIDKYLESDIVKKNVIYLFICEGGVWLNHKFEKIKDGSSEFHTTSEVEKMSKSKRNVINPDDIIKKYGADCFRMYEMFLGPVEMSKPWDTKGIDGVSRFLRKFWRLFYDDSDNWVVTNDKPTDAELKILYKTIKKVTADMENLSFNTSVSAFMICLNELAQLNCHKKEVLEKLLIILSPFAPHTCEYLWQKTGNTTSIVKATFPNYDEKLLVENTFTYPVAVNGKVRANVELPSDATSEQVESHVMELEGVKKWLEGKTPKKVIVVKGKMVNVVV